jgi:hypothetical protein
MSEQTNATVQSGAIRRTTVIYGKYFALIGIVVGLAMAFGTPGILLLFHEGSGAGSREWVESMPSWTAPAALCIGMGGGVLTTLLSTCFGLLIPDRVIREGGERESAK